MYIQCWFKLLNTQHFVNRAIKFVHAFLDHIEACYEIVRGSSVMFFVMLVDHETTPFDSVPQRECEGGPLTVTAAS